MSEYDDKKNVNENQREERSLPLREQIELGQYDRREKITEGEASNLVIPAPRED